MLARQTVLLTAPTVGPRLPRFAQFLCNVSPLAATLMDFPTSVANKRLTEGVSPLDATLTKNGGWGLQLSGEAASKSAPTTTRVSPYPYSLPPIPFPFILLQGSPTQRHQHNSFLLNRLHTLSIATEGVPHRGILVIATQSNRSSRAQRPLPYIVTSLLPYLARRASRACQWSSVRGTCWSANRYGWRCARPRL